MLAVDDAVTYFEVEVIMISSNERERKNGMVISIDFTDPAQRKKQPKVTDLEQLMHTNRRNQERLRKERATTNKSVLRTYRIKKNEKK